MAARSTREKIRWNVGRASERIEQALASLKHVEELGDGRSQLINEHLPEIVLALEVCRHTLLAFREEL